MKNFCKQLNSLKTFQWMLLLTLTYAFFCYSLPAQAFVDTTVEVNPVLNSAVTPTGEGPLISKLERYQVNGLNTNLETALPWGKMQLVGGLFQSKLSTNNARPALYLVGDNRQPSSALAMFSNLFSTKKASGQASQLFFQSLDYIVGGLKLTGSYADTGAGFQGLDELTKQLAPSSARLLGLGTTIAEYGISYNNGNGLEFASNSTSRENHQPGNKENGLTRINSTQKMAMQFSPRMRFEYNNASIGEEWLAGKGQTNRNTNAQSMKFTAGLGEKSEISLGQSATSTKSGKSFSEKTRLRNVAFKWLDMPGFTLNGSLLEKTNGLTDEENTTWNMESSWQVDPRLSFTGKWLSNKRTIPAAGQTDSELLQLSMSATLASNVRFSSKYGTVENPTVGKVATHEQQINWQPEKNLALQTRLTNTDSNKNGATYSLDQSVSAQIGTVARAEELALRLTDETLPQDTHQQRGELNYRRSLGSTPAAGTVRIQIGTANRTQLAANNSGSFLALQADNVPIDSRTSLTLGYYDGARYGAGNLNYRNWGHRIAGNNNALLAQDFVDFQEYGGVITHRPGKSTTIFLKQVQGEEAGNGEFSMLEYGFEQSFGSIKLQASENHSLTPGKGDSRLLRNTTLWKVSAPISKPLPEWAKKSLAYDTVSDSAAWGFNKLPTWQSNAVPTAGITAEKKQVLDAGKTRDQYSVQGAVMLGKNSFLLARYDDNPYKAGTIIVDKTQRAFVQYTMRAKENMQLFSRYTTEDRHDNAAATSTLSLGLTGIVSSSERLQLQLDLLEKRDSNSVRNGSALIFAYDRKVSPQDSLALRLRLTPETFVDKEYPVAGELSWQRAF